VDTGADLNLTQSLKTEIVTKGLAYSLGTGNWTANRGQTTKTGVSQVLNRLTFASTLSHLRRMNTPIGRESKLAKPRQLHNTHWGTVLMQLPKIFSNNLGVITEFKNII
jgi:DNA-directed RNA polymerase II subunit RPB2